MQSQTLIAPAVNLPAEKATRVDPLRAPACWVFIALCLETIFSVAYRSVSLATNSVRLSFLAGLALLLVAGLLLRFHARIAALCASISSWQPSRAWYPFWLLFGVVTRLSWHLVFHTVPRSDGRTYFNLASSLALNHHYDGAFYPPGLPLFEAPFLMVLGAHFWVASLCTLLTFLGTFAVVRLLGQELSGEPVGAIACALLAVWPNDVAAVGSNPKEALLALLVTTCLWLYLRASRHSGIAQLGCVALAGLLAGCSALTQPAFLLFPTVMIGCELLWHGITAAGLRRIIVLGVATLAAIAPWAVRNYTLFHRPVLISVNGGSVFYRANNPNANAQYSPEGAETFGSDPFAASDAGYRAARLWIRQHPLDFAKLMVRKQVVYLGDDSDRIYESLKRDQQPSALVYAGSKLLANLFWMSLFLFLVAASTWLFRPRDWRLWYGICVLPLLYQWAIDSVFEAGARHHVPYLGLISILVALGVASAGSIDKQQTAS